MRGAADQPAELGYQAGRDCLASSTVQAVGWWPAAAAWHGALPMLPVQPLQGRWLAFQLCCSMYGSHRHLWAAHRALHAAAWTARQTAAGQVPCPYHQVLLSRLLSGKLGSWQVGCSETLWRCSGQLQLDGAAIEQCATCIAILCTFAREPSQLPEHQPCLIQTTDTSLRSAIGWQCRR